MSAVLETVRAAWGAKPPEWVMRLATEVSGSSQNRVAKRLGYSAGTISAVLHNKYNADTAAIEERVRGMLMAEVVNCPALGWLPTSKCQDFRRKAKTFSGQPLRVRMARACAHCPVNRKGES